MAASRHRDHIRDRRRSLWCPLAERVILILGGANLIADGFAMAASNYLATRSEHEEFEHAEAVERRRIKTFPEGEWEEVSEILTGLGMVG